MSENQFNESNIFKELSGELDFGKELEQNNLKQTQVKDLIYYMKIFAKFLFIRNMLLFVVLFFLFSYIKIQNNDSLLEASYLNPFCPILVGSEISREIGDCSSVSALINKYDASIKQIKEESTKKIIDIAPVLFAVKNFTLSKDVKFLLDRSQNRLKPLEIFTEFDKIKNSFTSQDKGQIKCQNIEITSDNILSISCSAYTSDWNTSIQTREIGKKTSGTSISLAASFINYIEKNSSNFEIIDKPKSFNQENYSGNGYYTKKTDFKLNLKYNSNKINF